MAADHLRLIPDLLAALRAGRTTPTELCRRAVDCLSADPALVLAWVPWDADATRAASQLDLPLAGLPFVVKDNIDVARVPTTAGCPGYSFVPTADAAVVAALRAAGAIPVAKVAMDQFATGLVGTRSPTGVPRNPLVPDRIPGGSSSGSAVAVSLGAVAFALGTDTAGSGRVPAAATNVVGLKPTKGRLSTCGLVPACRSLDCISVFAGSCADAATVMRHCGGYDDNDPWARRPPATSRPISGRIGILAGQDLDLDAPAHHRGYAAVVGAMQELGLAIRAVPYAAFAAAAELLYQGPWLAERQLAVGPAIAAGVAGMDPVVADIIGNGQAGDARSCFAASYRLHELARTVEGLWEGLDALLLPTIPGLPTLAQVAAEPVAVNTRLGRYTNFVNILDCCAVAFPAALTADGPVGATLVAPAWQEDRLTALAAQLHPRLVHTVGATTCPVPDAAPAAIDAELRRPLAVVGAHLAGQPLHHQLLSAGATLRTTTTTAPRYRLVALPGGPPRRPGLLRVSNGETGHAIAVEVYDLPLAAWGHFLARIAPPLGIGNLEMADGSWVAGFLCESHATAGADDISRWGGWRAWLAR